LAPRNKSSRKRIKKNWTSQNFDFKKAIFWQEPAGLGFDPAKIHFLLFAPNFLLFQLRVTEGFQIF
jgi:hypothetical protein